MSQPLSFSNEQSEVQTLSAGMSTETQSERPMAHDLPPPLIPVNDEQVSIILPLNIFTGNQSLQLDVSEEDGINTSSSSPESVQETIDGSPSLKRARFSDDAREADVLMTVALTHYSTDEDQWEVPSLETIDAMLNNSIQEYEAAENFGSKLETVLGDLTKKVEGLAATSLPFIPKDTPGVKKTSDACINQSEKREIDVQVDLQNEEETAQLVELRKLVDEQQRSLLERSQELETANKTLKQKEIGFAAATALLGLSFEDCVRKNAELAIARAAPRTPPRLALPAPPTPPTPPTPVIPATQAIPATSTPIVQGRTLNPITPQRAEASTSADTAPPRVSSNPPTPAASYGIAKDEYSRLNRRNSNGVYEGAFPLHDELMKRFATGCSAALFVKLVLEHCYTDAYLETHTLTRMNDTQVEAITNVTMHYFTEFRTRQDTTPQPMNRPQVRTFISQILQNKKAAAKRRSSK